MRPIKHILFPFDFSARANATVPYVDWMARRFAAKITLLTTLPSAWDFGFTGPDPETADLQALTEKLQHALVDKFAGLTVDRITLHGDPAMRIVDFAHIKDVGLIMMPTHGWGSFRGLLLGSVTAKVLHDAQCPVWTAAHIETPLNSPGAIQNIVCAIDDTPGSEELMRWAAAFASSTGARLHLIHSAMSISDWASLKSEQALQEEVRQAALANAEMRRKAAGVDAPLRVVVGDPAEAIRDEALRNNADLVILGRGVLHETLGRLRTNAYAIIRRVPCAALSV
jgi:nucleotide-binding universal stress UspA family protein